MLNNEAPAFQSALKRLGIPPDTSLIFSPFQTLSVADIRDAFGIDTPRKAATPATTAPRTSTPAGRASRDHLFVKPTLTERHGPKETDAAARIRIDLEALFKSHGDITAAATAFSHTHQADTKEAFYPLITYLFQIAGYRSDVSRHGVNYQRWDAAVWIDKTAIPIEVKSPTEERELSTKSIRQALENKVILLSRGGIDTRPELTSLIVGFSNPAERSEMANLIDDIYKAYNLRIGVIDLSALTKLALLGITANTTITGEQLQQLRGFLDV